LGVEGASFGSIYEDINDTVLGGKPTILDVETLAKSGPAWAAEWQPPRERLSGLPEFCERHRLELLGLGNGHQSQKLVGADHSEKVALEFAGKSSS